MMTDEQIAEIEARHHVTDHWLPEVAICHRDSERMPCDALRLIAEVRRLNSVMDDVTFGAEGSVRLGPKGWAIWAGEDAAH